MLLALGRMPNTASLDLQNAGVKTEDGRIVTDDTMQTPARRTFSRPAIAPGRMRSCTSPFSRAKTPRIISCQPRRAAPNGLSPADLGGLHRAASGVVGLTEKAATARGIKYLAASYPFNDHGKSLIMEAKDGFVKLLADPTIGRNSRRQLRGPGGRRIDP